MKILLGFMMTLLMSAHVVAKTELPPQYYSAVFRATKSSPQCPPPKPGRVGCMSIGSIVTIEATIGCADELLFTDVTVSSSLNAKVADIYVVSIVKKSPKSDVIRCAKANTVSETVLVSGYATEFSVLNLETEFTR